MRKTENRKVKQMKRWEKSDMINQWYKKGARETHNWRWNQKIRKGYTKRKVNERKKMKSDEKLIK